MPVRSIDLLQQGTDAANAVGVDLRATVVPSHSLLRLWRVRHACPRICSMKKGAGNRSRRPRKAGPLPIWGVPVNLKLRISQAEFGCRPGPPPPPTYPPQHNKMSTEEGSGGRECVTQCTIRRSADYEKKNKDATKNT